MFARVVHARRSHDGLKGKLKGKGVLFTVHHLKMKKRKPSCLPFVKPESYKPGMRDGAFCVRVESKLRKKGRMKRNYSL